MLGVAARWAVVLVLALGLMGCDQSPGIRIMTLGIEYPGIEPRDILINGEPPKRNEGKALHTWEWPGLGPGVYEITYTIHGAPVRTVVETHIAGAWILIEFAGVVESNDEAGEYTILEPTTPVRETGYVSGGESVCVWVENGYYGPNRVTNISLGGYRANRSVLGPPQMLYWDNLPLGRHDLRYEYGGQIYSGTVVIHQRGAMFGILDGFVVVVDERFGEMPGRSD